MGLAPANPSAANYESNFLVQLQKEKKIDHLVTSIYMRHNNGNSSNIKFGSWDSTGMAAGSSLRMVRTASLDQWSIMADDYSIGGSKFLTNADRRLVYSPHMPYLYMPSTDWSSFAIALQKSYPDVHCVYAENRCSW